MFKIPGIPSSRAPRDELADFAEWLAWKQGAVSAREIQAALGRLDENNDNEGCEDSSDDLSNFLDEVMTEIEVRESACGGTYPFRLNQLGTALNHAGSSENICHHVYHFLLLATRLDMNSNRVHAELDGADIFEHLSAHILANYLGGPGTILTETKHNILRKNRAYSWVFGTGTRGTFEDKVQRLCDLTNEGGRYKNNYGAIHHAKDDKLDIVAWVPFQDQKISQLIVFAQCKTGTHWENQTTQTQPDAFAKKWLERQFVVNPIRAFMVAECLDRLNWGHSQVEAGLFFDRCRILDFCHDLPENLIENIRCWNHAAREDTE